MNTLSAGSVLVTVAPLLMVLAVWTNPGWRHVRIVGPALVWLAVWYGVELGAGQNLRAVSFALLVGVFAAGITWPARLGLSTVSTSERDLDRVFRRASQYFGADGMDPSVAFALVGEIDVKVAKVDAIDWKVAAALFRRTLLHRGGAEISSTTSIAAYEHAGTAFWRAALQRGLIGRPFRTDAWDEGMALRCYFEEFQSLILPAQSVTPQSAPVGDWSDSATDVIAAVSSLSIGDSLVSHVRDSIARAMADELEVARRGPRAQSLQRQAESARAVQSEWLALSIREAEALAARDSSG
jgi:hypothetical protein